MRGEPDDCRKEFLGGEERVPGFYRGRKRCAKKREGGLLRRFGSGLRRKAVRAEVCSIVWGGGIFINKVGDLKGILRSTEWGRAQRKTYPGHNCCKTPEKDQERGRSVRKSNGGRPIVFDDKGWA